MACSSDLHASRSPFGSRLGSFGLAGPLTRVVGLRPGHTGGREHEDPDCADAPSADGRGPYGLRRDLVCVGGPRPHTEQAASTAPTAPLVRRLLLKGPVGAVA